MSDNLKINPDEIPVEQLTYEQALAQMEEIVAVLEEGEQPLDKALTLFERGQNLALHCGDLLDQTELRVKQILGEELVDFEEQ